VLPRLLIETLEPEVMFATVGAVVVEEVEVPDDSPPPLLLPLPPLVQMLQAVMVKLHTLFGISVSVSV